VELELNFNHKMFFTSRFIALMVGMALALSAYSQGSITGTVLDSLDNPLEGASVVLKKNQRVYPTSSKGKFKIESLEYGTYELRVSYVGYKTKNISVDVLADEDVEIKLKKSPFLKDEFVVEATRYSRKAPATFKNIEKKEIEELNLGQDLPRLLNWTPSMVTTSDAGAGVGYTSMRIRGSDQTRINVTVNGIPINDSESQGVFWVNMPDFASSLSSVQIQRGLGSSTNGSGAFGASVNMETNHLTEGPTGIISSSAGSFNTFKNTVEFSTGRMENGFAVDGRLSSIQSDGYIDRASSDLKSYFLSAGYYGEKTIVKALTFAGQERTYQSWYGTPESRLENDVEGMLQHAANEGYTEAQTQNLLNSGRTYNYYLYENEVDNYNQDHYQLHWIQNFNENLQMKLSGHYTYGRGYFEQYRNDDSFEEYGLSNIITASDTISESDFIRRRWLDNDFYGGVFSLDYQKGNHQIIVGGGVHLYRGDHFGEIQWAEFNDGIPHEYRYYDNYGNKDDINGYVKWNGQFGDFNLMADVQYRFVDYETRGIDADQRFIDVTRQFNFINPKIGARYALDEEQSLYFYAGIGNREPVRNDFIDAPEGTEPEAEQLTNFELGYSRNDQNLRVNVNGYAMLYRDQLVLTGELNDVGAAIRTNVDQSYRIGLELDATYFFNSNFSWNVNATFSENKIANFESILYDYTNGFDVLTTEFENTDISFSPSVIGASRLMYTPLDGLDLMLISKYVGDQYLDNTQNENRKIDAYFVNDFRIAYTIENKVFERIEISLLVNNIFNEMYTSNGYTYSYVFGEEITENFYYPQAGTNFLAGVQLQF
jgi:iron complex outermembrane receptor protein